jgi:hypothetical protein
MPAAEMGSMAYVHFRRLEDIECPANDMVDLRLIYQTIVIYNKSLNVQAWLRFRVG